MLFPVWDDIELKLSPTEGGLTLEEILELRQEEEETSDEEKM